jgi:hypothetical protein
MGELTSSRLVHVMIDDGLSPILTVSIGRCIFDPPDAPRSSSLGILGWHSRPWFSSAGFLIPYSWMRDSTLIFKWVPKRPVTGCSTDSGCAPLIQPTGFGFILSAGWYYGISGGIKWAVLRSLWFITCRTDGLHDTVCVTG